MTVNNGLEFFLWIKLLKLNEQGKTVIAPCEMNAQICVNLYEFIETWRGEETTLYEAKLAVKEALGKIQRTFNCPLGWLMTAEREEDTNFWLEAKSFSSPEFFFSPEHFSTEIDLSFIKGWLFEPGDSVNEDFSDLYLDENDRKAIAQN